MSFMCFLLSLALIYRACVTCVYWEPNNMKSLEKQEYCVVTIDIMVALTLSLIHQQCHVFSLIILDITDVGLWTDISKF